MINNQTKKICFFLLILLCFTFLFLQVQQLPSTLMNIHQKSISINMNISKTVNNTVDFSIYRQEIQFQKKRWHKKFLNSNQKQSTFLSHVETNRNAQQHAEKILLRIIVITMQRAQSLKRLLHSLLDAEYYDDRVALDVWIDLPPSQTDIDAKTKEIVTNFSWPHGPKTLHFRVTNVGLRQQWLESWNLSVPGGLRPELNECALILEDDVVVSPLFWKWLKQAHAQYRYHANIAGFSLQGLELCAGKCKSHVTQDIPDGTNFLYPLVGSWGFSPRTEHWINFTKWASNYLPKESREKPYVENTVLTTWYKSFETTGRCPGKNCMWTQLHHYYTSFSMDKYTLYLKAPQNKALCHNHRERGLHFDKGMELSVGNRLIKIDENLTTQFQETPIVLNYNGDVTGSMQTDLKYLSSKHAKCQKTIKWLPVMFLNLEFTKFFDNWIYYANIHMPNLHACMLYVALDLHAFEFLIKNYNPNFLYLWNTKQQHEMKFATPDYVKHIEERFLFMISLLQNNLSIAVMEPDQVLLGDIFKFINQKEEDSVKLNEIITYDDDRHGMLLPCNGFLFLRNSDRVLAMISNLQKRLAQQPVSKYVHHNDQHLARTILKEFDFRVWFLPKNRFIGGHQLEGKTNKDIFRDAFFVHANYVIGTQQKIDLLKRNRLWFPGTQSKTHTKEIASWSEQNCVDFGILSKLSTGMFFSETCAHKSKNNCVRLGSLYGGHEFPRKFCSLGSDAIVYTFGVGEDISFEITLAAVYNFSIRLFDPTPRAARHVAAVSHILKTKKINEMTRSLSKDDEYFFQNQTMLISGNVNAIDWLENSARLSHKIVQPFDFRPYALSTTDSFVNFFPPKEGVSHSLLTKNNPESLQPLLVKSKKLTSIMNEMGDERITILKIDIEGFEIHVIPELVVLFRSWETFRWPRIIIFDMDSLRPDHMHHNQPKAKECIQMLLDIGYFIFSQHSYDYTFMR